MKILPPVSQPWDEVFVRRHTPTETTAAKGFRRYRPCLRWEFGFSCAFCLVHEVDLGLAAGGSLMETEHFVPISLDPEGENSYPNCFYSCHFCNHHRGTRPVLDRSSGQLLNPCKDVWQEYFVLDDDELRPRNGHPDAVYTQDAYDLNDPRKVRMRYLRRGVIEDCLETYREAKSLSEELMTQATQAASLESEDPGLNVERLRQSQDLWYKYKKAWRQLEWYAVIPWDADQPCVCRSSPSLPDVMDRQAIDVDPPC